MNLHTVATGIISAVNPSRLASVQISAGYDISASVKRTPKYETPAAFTASIADAVMTVSAIASGKLGVGQTIAGADVTAGTKISGQLSGDPGGIGTYSVVPGQTVSSQDMTSSLFMGAQVQALTYKDLTQIDGLNLNGQRRAIYLYGDIEGVVRADNKGGDLITMLDDNTGWLTAMVLETWPGWCKVVATRQV